MKLGSCFLRLLFLGAGVFIVRHLLDNLVEPSVNLLQVTHVIVLVLVLVFFRPFRRTVPRGLLKSAANEPKETLRLLRSVSFGRAFKNSRAGRLCGKGSSLLQGQGGTATKGDGGWMALLKECPRISKTCGQEDSLVNRDPLL